MAPVLLYAWQWTAEHQSVSEADATPATDPRYVCMVDQDARETPALRAAVWPHKLCACAITQSLRPEKIHAVVQNMPVSHPARCGVCAPVWLVYVLISFCRRLHVDHGHSNCLSLPVAAPALLFSAAACGHIALASIEWACFTSPAAAAPVTPRVTHES